MIVSLEQAKLHLRLDEDDQDEIISLYIRAAQERIEAYLNRRVLEFGDLVITNEIFVNAAIQAAALLYIGHLERNRESVVVGTIASVLPNGFEALLMPYRSLMGV